jgi:hypothetical protein
MGGPILNPHHGKKKKKKKRVKGYQKPGGRSESVTHRDV